MEEGERCILPGGVIPAEMLSIPSNTSHVLKLGPGLRHVPPSAIISTTAGELCIDQKKNTVWVENCNGRYIPTIGDLVIAQLHHSSPEVYFCAITSYTAFASLPHLAFASATKKTRPQLGAGSIVYARISLANKHFDPELECVNPNTNKADGLGELNGGMIFDISLVMARRLMMPGGKGAVCILEEFAQKTPFEVAVGRNGKLWIESKAIKTTLVIGNAIVETDREALDLNSQRTLVRKLLKAI